MECPECGRTLPEGKNRCLYCGGVADTPAEQTGRDEAGDRIPGFGEEQRDVVHYLGTKTTKRRKPMSRILQVLIFFASAAIMGALVWLLG